MTFQPGNTLGKGRPPRGQSITEMLRIALHERGEDGRTMARIIADVLVDKAVSGDIQAIREIADRVEGRPPIQVDPTTTADRQRPINIMMTEADRAAM